VIALQIIMTIPHDEAQTVQAVDEQIAYLRKGSAEIYS